MGGNRASLLPSSLGNECASSSSANFPEAQFRPSPPRVIIIPTCKVEDGTVELSHFHTADRGQEKKTRDTRGWLEYSQKIFHFFIGIPSDLLAGAIDDRFLTLAAAAAVVVVVVVVRRVYSIFSSLFWEAIVRHRGKSFSFFFQGREEILCSQARPFNWGRFSFFWEHSFCPPLSFAPNWD